MEIIVAGREFWKFNTYSQNLEVCDLEMLPGKYLA